jgi:hypothetical protein
MVLFLFFDLTDKSKCFMQYFRGLYFSTDPVKDPNLDGNSVALRTGKLLRRTNPNLLHRYFITFCFNTILNFRIVIIRIGVKSVRVVVKSQ